MNIIPKIRLTFGEAIGTTIFVSHPEIGSNEKTYLSSDAISSVSTFSVDNGLKFSSGEYLVLGALTGEKTELISFSSGSASAITISGASSFAHNRGEPLTFIPYNQIIIQRSTDSGSSYSDLATIDIRIDSNETQYIHTSGSSTDYYRIKFYNSASTDESSPSDGVISTGLAENTVGYVIRAALVSLGERIDDIITKEFLYQTLTEGREELDQQPEIQRWPFRINTGYDAGDVIPGQNTLTVPTTLRDPATYQNILSLRIGRNGRPLIPVDRQILNSHYVGTAKTTLASSITSGSTSLVLTTSGDFDDSGSVDVAASSVSETIDSVDYTTNNKSTKTLSGVTNIADSKDSGTLVWQGISFGTPTRYCVENGIITFSQPFDDSLVGENVWMDFYSKLSVIDSDGDTFDEPSPLMYVPYLKWRIKSRRDRSLERESDNDWKDWEKKKNDTVQKVFYGQDMRFSYNFL